MPVRQAQHLELPGTVIGYLLLVAIANLGLGWLLACVVMHWPVSWNVAQISAGDLGDFEQAAAPQSGFQDAAQHAAEEQAAKSKPSYSPRPTPEETRTDTANSNHRAESTWRRALTWSDLGQQVQGFKDRIRYARSAGDRRLAQEIASQLEHTANAWSSELQRLLESEESSAERSAGADSADDATQMEFCLAQLETTLVNLKSVDWSDSVDSILDRLDREAKSLSTAL